MKVVMACGGTGGHIFPAFSVAEELRRRNPRTEIVYVCGKKDIESAIFKIVKDEKVLSIESAPLLGPLSFARPLFLIKLVRGFWKSVRVLKKESPDLVVGFGGHASFPMTFAACLMGMKTLVHEQNVIPGAANRWLSRWVNGVALSFEDSKVYLKNIKRCRVTGNPVRPSLERASRDEALKFFGFSGEKKTLLVLGGSQGAQSINHVFLRLLSLVPEGWRPKLQVLHLCGKMPAEEALAIFKETGFDARVYSFFDRMDLVYAVTDLAIGRAGATFLAEAAAMRKRAILIPYPYGNGHQLLNARLFCRDHGARVIEQKNLSVERLKKVLLEELEAMGKVQEHMPGSFPKSRELLADFIEETAAR